MSAGSSPTGGIGGIFYAILLLTGVILKQDKNALKHNAKTILPIVLILAFTVVVVLNILVIGKYVDLNDFFQRVLRVPQLIRL